MGDDGSLVQVAGGCHWYTQAPHACTSVSQQQQWSQQPYAQLQLEQEQQLMQQHSFVNSWYTVQQQQGQGQQQMYTPGQGQLQLQQHAVHSMQPSNQHEQQQQQQQQQNGFILLPDGQTWQEVVSVHLLLTTMHQSPPFEAGGPCMQLHKEIGFAVKLLYYNDCCPVIMKAFSAQLDTC
jgi:hypothetical protein